MESFIAAQQSGIDTWLRIGDYVKFVKLRCPLAFVIGDAKSGDMLCGRYGGYNTRRISRHCHVRLKQCNDPEHVCCWVSQNNIDRITDEALPADSASDLNNPNSSPHTRANLQKDARKKLHRMSQHCHRSAFRDVCFGIPGRGIVDATPTDLMHAFLEGSLKYALRIFFDNVPPSVKAQVDFLVDEIFGNLRSSEKANMLRTNFTHGMSNLTMITADEWAGMAMTLLCLCRLQRGYSLLKVMFRNKEIAIQSIIEKNNRFHTSGPLGESDPSRDSEDLSTSTSIGADPESDTEIVFSVPDQSDSSSSNGGIAFGKSLTAQADVVSLAGTIDWNELTQLLEQFLSFHAWYKRGAPYTWNKSINQEYHRSKIHKKITNMMALLIRVLPRQSGNGWCIQKFHELLHVSHFMVQFGSPSNWDAGPGESSLKTFAKKTGQHSAEARSICVS